MKRPAYNGAYSRRHFSNFSAASKAPVTGEFSLSVRSGDPSMGEVAVSKLTEPSPLSSESAEQENAGDRGHAAGNRFRAKATAFKGFRFVKWETNLPGIAETTSNPIDFAIGQDTVLVARFEKAGSSEQPTRTAKVSWNGRMGRVNGDSLVLSPEAREGNGVVSATQGSSVTLTASPLAGYRFVKWHGAPLEGKTSPSVTFQMNANYSISAEFASSDTGTGGGGGGISGGGASGSGTTETPSTVKTSSGVVAFVKKWWWALLIAAYVIYKEGGSK